MEKVRIKNLDGTIEDVELVNYFNVKDINRNFVIYSKGEKIKEGMSKLYVSEVLSEAPGKYKLIGISDESIWDRVKQAMKEMVQGA